MNTKKEELELSMEEMWDLAEKARIEHLQKIQNKKEYFKSVFDETCELIKKKNIPVKVVSCIGARCSLPQADMFYIVEPTLECCAFVLNLDTGETNHRLFSSENELNETVKEEIRSSPDIINFRWHRVGIIPNIPLKKLISDYLNNIVSKPPQFRFIKESQDKVIPKKLHTNFDVFLKMFGISEK